MILWCRSTYPDLGRNVAGRPRGPHGIQISRGSGCSVQLTKADDSGSSRTSGSAALSRLVGQWCWTSSSRPPRSRSGPTAQSGFRSSWTASEELMQIPRLTPCPDVCALKRQLLDHPGDLIPTGTLPCPIPTCGIGQGVPLS